MKTQNNEEMILKYLEKNPNVSAEVISESTGIFKLNVFKIVKGMLNDKVLSVNGQTKPQLYSLNTAPNARLTKNTHGVVKEHQPIQDAKTQKKGGQERQKDAQEENLAYKKGPRDTSKLVFQDVARGKGPTVLAIVSDYVSKNPKVSLQKLKEIFPDNLQPRYGFIVETPLAKRRTVGEKERYFWKAPLTVAGKKVVVCSQWGAGKSFDTVLRIAKELGYKIQRR